MAKTDVNRREQICNSILEGIFTSEYKTGQILTEAELISRYGCSKTLIREALVSLSSSGVLRSIPRYGYELVRLTREDIEDTMKFRYVIEGGALLSCIDYITPAQVELLRSINSEGRIQDDLWRHWENNYRFHLQLIAFSQNRCAYTELERALERLKRAFAQFYWEKWQDSTGIIDTQCHSKIIDNIEAGNAKGALEELRKDLNSFGTIYYRIDNVFSRPEQDG